ncbi:hypothetical protein IC229_28860 [Spirosoma sp. BT702]|uniref:Piwi domain-containing protein n=1 Tax=Spirosoma profusum TaxID=2771354 RepID=A0A927AUK2_9BACT|nr:hypothetical protein [Spirosoma profusum]MBD2704681.1 hypothetical protein [Spirosoma profusum]
MKPYKLKVLPEPRLKFAYNQKLTDPRDGLTLYGPCDKSRANNFSVGIIGTLDGMKIFKGWMNTIQKPVSHPKSDIAKPFFPGFEEVYGIQFDNQNYVELNIDPSTLQLLFRYTDDHVRIANIVDLYVDELIRYKQEVEIPVSLWFVIIPDMVYQLCRPMSKVPKTQNSLSVGIKDIHTRLNEGLFEDESLKRMRLAYNYEKDFHDQLKIKLLSHGILTQVIREGTISKKEPQIKNGKIKEEPNFETDIAWSLTTSIYYKATGLPPWKLADIRDGVCYIGLVFKNDDRQQDRKIACCAAQMFLDSGDGQVFKGAVGPWYNPETKEHHLSKASAKDLLSKALSAYKASNNSVPREIFIHGRTFFNDEEWGGFQEAVGDAKSVIGIRITHEHTFKLFRESKFPVMRGTVYAKDHRSAYLWTKGFIPRLQTVVGLETPNPIQIQIMRGETNIFTVCRDVLALTKLNYNTCKFADGVPVTLKFADTIGEILTAGPHENLKVLPFKYYI